MTAGQIRDAVALALENLQTTDPFYAQILGNASYPSTIRTACNKIVTIAAGGNGAVANMFPELHDVEQIGPSTAASNALARPADALLVFDLTSAQSNTAPNWNLAREYPVTFVPAVEFGYLTKSTTSVSGWARLWTRNGTTMNIWPTPTASYVDYFRVYYLKQETMADGDSTAVPKLDARWFDILVRLTVALVLEKMMRFEDAKNLMGSVVTEIQITANFVVAESHPLEIHVSRAPTRAMVYGR